MKTVSKKLLSLMLVAILLVSAIPFQAFATDDLSGDPIMLEEGTPVVDPAVVVEPIADVEPVVEAEPIADVEPVVDNTPVVEPIVDETPIVPVVPESGEGAVIPETPVTPDPMGGGSVTHDETHASYGKEAIWLNEYNHYYKCNYPGCDHTEAAEACTVDQTTHKCSVCKHVYEEAHKYTITVAAQVDPTCTTNGKTAIKECEICHITTGGETINSLGGHHYVDGTCTNCGDTQKVVEVTWYAGEGHTFNNNEYAKLTRLTVGKDIPYMETPKDPNGEFLGWYIATDTGASTGVPVDTTKPYANDGNEWTKAVAMWKTTSYKVTFYRILNNQLSTATLITEVSLTPETNLAQYVTSSGILANEKATHPGYKLNYDKDYPVKKYVNGVFSPLSTTDVAKNLRTVYINLTPDTFTLSLNANGGTVTPVKIEGIAYGTTVKLPTPTKTKAVFQGWVDTAGNKYTDKLTYNFTSDATLTACWDDEANVWLRIFINGDFSKPDRIVQLNGYITGSKVLRLKSNGSSDPDVTSIIGKYYTSSTGTGLNVRGLFKSEADWESFRSNQSMSGDPVVTVENNSVISVMVYNAKAGSTPVVNNPNNSYDLPTSVPNNGNAYYVITSKTTGYWVYTDGAVPQGAYKVGSGDNSYYVYDPNNYLGGYNGSTTVTVPTYIYIGTNPKTGDTAKIEIAAGIMVLAAVALITIMILRKKKSV